MSAIPPLGVRLPQDVKEKIKASALQNRRSMNAEIIVALESIYSSTKIHETKKADATA
ncbi:hypothetical protein GGQ73_000680 [Rhizobium skierniewicense]|uniref:Arc-like DNA binding domain-containing protein n=1 Tax=Rhizobium skierniewicense TaxID=984260 RepID=A0A7W6C2X5_9HYPH|nr:Arc family DNA-binding protein [Rhizobium skierniewicense]MBB3944755.1 hypothetical protein [Rhizobium skierniewicense]